MAHSPSKLDESADCIRRFAWQVVDPLPYTKSPEAELGDLIHAVGEDYHTHGKMPDSATVAGKAFKPALQYVPRPLTGNAEGKFRFRVAGQEFSGRIDLSCHVRDLPCPPPGWDPDWPVVIDYKSVKALSKRYMLEDRSDFLQNRQAIVYAAKRLVETKATHCVLWWIYLRRPSLNEAGQYVGRPAAELRFACVDLREITEAFGRLVFPLAQKLTQIRTNKTNPLDLDPNPESCLRYGERYACPRIKQCNLDLADTLKGLEDVDLLDEMQAETSAPETKEQPKPAARKTKGINPEPLAGQDKPEDTSKKPAKDAPASDGTVSWSELGDAVRVIKAFGGHVSF